MNQSASIFSKIKSSFFFVSAIAQSVTGIYLLRQAIIRRNGILNYPAIVLLLDCGKNIIHLIGELKNQRNVKQLPPPSKTSHEGM